MEQAPDFSACLLVVPLKGRKRRRKSNVLWLVGKNLETLGQKETPAAGRIENSWLRKMATSATA